ncbi:MAG: lytic transglycosylase domain-containing protein [Acidobacteria bacterium]|nr:lytic transglycosylase domain-containing protein [Acidobacteriota bacterium]
MRIVFSSLVALVVPAIALAGGPPSGTCSLSALDGVRLLLARSTVADLASGDLSESDKRWREFARAATAVLGAEVAAEADAETRAEYVAALHGKQVVTVACDAGSVSRDRAAYRLGLLGYSLDDIARMVTGRVSRSDIDSDAARRLACLPPRPLSSTPSTSDVAAGPVLVAGGHASARSGLWNAGELATLPLPRTRPAVFRPASALVPVQSALQAPGFPVPIRPGLLAVGATPALRMLSPSSAVIDWWTRYYSLAYGVDYQLVAAIIRQESNWQPAIVSNKGAVGLMQLMPATAAMLRVNPRDPIENLRGGIAYLAGLLSNYGSVRSALIAYNAGPAHADQVLRGEREPFPETQRYLSAVDAFYSIDAKR